MSSRTLVVDIGGYLSGRGQQVGVVTKWVYLCSMTKHIIINERLLSGCGHNKMSISIKWVWSKIIILANTCMLVVSIIFCIH